MRLLLCNPLILFLPQHLNSQLEILKVFKVQKDALDSQVCAIHVYIRFVVYGYFLWLISQQLILLDWLVTTSNDIAPTIMYK